MTEGKRQSSLNYASSKLSVPFVVKGSYQYAINHSSPMFRFLGNTMFKPIEYESTGSWYVYGYDAIGYEKMKTKYTRYVVTHCDLELRFTNITPHDPAAVTTPLATILVHIQELNSQDTAIDATNVSYQFEAQPKCSTLVLQTNAMGSLDYTCWQKTLSGVQLGGEYWDPTDLAWSGQFNNTKPTNWFGVQFTCTDATHVLLSSPMQVAVEVRYTMYGNAFGLVPLDDV